jgi:hypothetical protein
MIKRMMCQDRLGTNVSRSQTKGFFGRAGRLPADKEALNLFANTLVN